MPTIIVTESVIAKAAAAVKQLKDGQNTTAFKFGEKAGKAFVSLDQKALVHPTVVEFDGRTLYISLWERDR
jgi:hypothetical protein